MFRKYTWVANKIKDKDMAKLYQLKQQNKKTITAMVAEAVSQYIAREVKAKKEK